MICRSFADACGSVAFSRPGRTNAANSARSTIATGTTSARRRSGGQREDRAYEARGEGEEADERERAEQRVRLHHERRPAEPLRGGEREREEVLELHVEPVPRRPRAARGTVARHRTDERLEE